MKTHSDTDSNQFNLEDIYDGAEPEQDPSKDSSSLLTPISSYEDFTDVPVQQTHTNTVEREEYHYRIHPTYTSQPTMQSIQESETLIPDEGDYAESDSFSDADDSYAEPNTELDTNVPDAESSGFAIVTEFKKHVSSLVPLLPSRRNRYKGTEKAVGTNSMRILKTELILSTIAGTSLFLIIATVIGFVSLSSKYLQDKTTDISVAACIAAVFTTSAFIPFLIVLTIVMVIIMYIIFKKTGGLDPRRLQVSDSDTYGSDRMMSEKDIRSAFHVDVIAKNTDPIYGKLPTNEVVGRVLYYRPGNKNYNSSVVVFGASGSGKTRAFLANNVYQSIRREENMFIADPKLEIYALTSEQMRAEGYQVHLFATKPEFMQYSDPWNPLESVHGSFVKASMVANRILYTEGMVKAFWTDAAMALLTGMIQYVTIQPGYAAAGRNTLPEIMRMITLESENVKNLADTLEAGHPAMESLVLFRNADEKVKVGAIFNLGLKLGLFSGGDVKRLVSSSSFSILDAAGSGKHAYFIGTDDQDDTFDFLSGLFINFVYIDLIALIDTFDDRRSPRPITIYMEEAAQLGAIQGLTRKLSASRSRNLSTISIYQDINQLIDIYGESKANTIMNNCASWVAIGSNDMVTNEFLCKRAGTMTVIQRSERFSENTIGEAVHFHSTKLASYGEGKRETLSLGEIFRSEDVLLFMSKSQPCQLKLFDMTEHPMYFESPNGSAKYHQYYAEHCAAVQREDAIQTQAASESEDSPRTVTSASKPIPGRVAPAVSQKPTVQNAPVQVAAVIPSPAILSSIPEPVFDTETDPYCFDARSMQYLNKKGGVLGMCKTQPVYEVVKGERPRWVYINGTKWTKDHPLPLKQYPQPPVYIQSLCKWYYQESIKSGSPVPLSQQLKAPLPEMVEKLTLNGMYILTPHIKPNFDTMNAAGKTGAKNNSPHAQ